MPSAEFNKAAEDVKKLTNKPADRQLLQIYALYKQATVGDNNTPKPSSFSISSQAKWNAWNDLLGLSQEDAETQYIDLVRSLQDA